MLSIFGCPLHAPVSLVSAFVFAGLLWPMSLQTSSKGPRHTKSPSTALSVPSFACGRLEDAKLRAGALRFRTPPRLHESRLHKPCSPVMSRTRRSSDLGGPSLLLMSVSVLFCAVACHLKNHLRLNEVLTARPMTSRINHARHLKFPLSIRDRGRCMLAALRSGRPKVLMMRLVGPEHKPANRMCTRKGTTARRYNHSPKWHMRSARREQRALRGPCGFCRCNCC